MNAVDTATRAAEAVRRCHVLAACSEEPGVITRTFLSPPMHDVHAQVRQWMQAAGMTVTVDHAGNVRGVYLGTSTPQQRLYIGSHLDTVPAAGAFDGILGVMLGLALVESLGGRRLPFAIEVVGFSEEEGVRFGTPFIGSRALAGSLGQDLLARKDAHGHTVVDAIRAFGLDPSRVGEARVDTPAVGYVEFHIEQGPVLDGLGLPLSVVDAIVGMSQLTLTFAGAANHAGTTPMTARHDPVAAAAEWVLAVERLALDTAGLVATVGQVAASPGATNVIAGTCTATLDVRHARDDVRGAAVATLLEHARTVATRRGLEVWHHVRLDHPATAMDARLIALLERAIADTGAPAHHMASGAGHDAMVLARHLPVAMLFLRSPGGLSHHPDEAVREADVAAALAVGRRFLDLLAAERS